MTMQTNSASKSTCPDISKLNTKNDAQKEMLKHLKAARKTCLEYEKCSKAKCDFPDLELKTELAKESMKNPSKIMSIVQSCLDSKDRTNCNLEKYAKISTKLKEIAEKVKKCKNETCKKENDKTIALANKMMQNLPVKQIINNVAKKTKSYKSNRKSSSKSLKKNN
jgi:hypothetical protein